MVGSLYNNVTDKARFKDYVVKVANAIKKHCNVKDWNKATEEQLKLRDKMHNNIALICEVIRHTDQAVKIGIEQALKDVK